jgi:hypothetical protein
MSDYSTRVDEEGMCNPQMVRCAVCGKRDLYMVMFGFNEMICRPCEKWYDITINDIFIRWIRNSL